MIYLTDREADLLARACPPKLRKCAARNTLFRVIAAEIARRGTEYRWKVTMRERQEIADATGYGLTAVSSTLADLRRGRPFPCPTREQRLEAELAAARQEIARLRRALGEVAR